MIFGQTYHGDNNYSHKGDNLKQIPGTSVPSINHEKKVLKLKIEGVFLTTVTKA